YIRKVFIRIRANRRGVRMLHATAAGAFAEMENKRVALERRPIHELQFVQAYALQVSLNLFLFPVVTMDHNPNLWLKPRQLKFFEFTCLDGSVNKSIVPWTIAATISSPA